MAKVPNAVEISPKVTTACVACKNVTDRQTTADGRATAYSEREREITFAQTTRSDSSVIPFLVTTPQTLAL